MANDKDFDWALRFSLRWEGGDHHPTLADPNPTRKGITQRFYDAVAKKYGWRQSSVFDLTDPEIAMCYRLIWEQSKAIQMPRLLACVHFDCSVNMSGPRANRVLQRALGVMADGVIGPRTLEAAQKALAPEVAKRQIHWREEEYKDLVEMRPILRTFITGWLNRTKSLKEYVGAA